ncbi:MAG: hypothetical protein ACRC7S_10065 [Cetobacterium sp.]
MSIVSKIAKFTIRAILSSLAKEAATAERKVAQIVAKRDRRIAKLDKEIIAMSKREDAQIAKIREQAELEVRNIIAAKRKKINAKTDLHWNAGAKCRNLNKKGQDALALKAKLEAVVK